MAVQHASLTGVNAIHVPYAGTYANAAARTAATDVSAADVGKLFRQMDDNSLWLLVGVNPLTWQAIGLTGVTTTPTAGGIPQAGSDGKIAAGWVSDTITRDTEVPAMAAHAAMPSERYIDITAPINTGMLNYTAPADGFISFYGVCDPAAAGYTEVSIPTKGIKVKSTSPYVNDGNGLLVPVGKNDVISYRCFRMINYTISRFIYAEGAY